MKIIDKIKKHKGAELLSLTLIFFFSVIFSPIIPINIPYTDFFLENLVLFIFIIIILAIISVFIQFEEGDVNSKDITVIATLSALAIALRIPFAAVPSFQPCTFLIIVAGLIYGPRIGFIVGSITPFVSNFFLGQGFHTPFMMFAWGLCGATAGLLGMARPNISTGSLAVFGYLWGFLYGWITNISMLIFYPLSTKAVITIYAISFWFDLAHAIGNAVFIFVFGPSVIWILKRYKRRFNVEFLDKLATPSA